MEVNRLDVVLVIMLVVKLSVNGVSGVVFSLMIATFSLVLTLTMMLSSVFFVTISAIVMSTVLFLMVRISPIVDGLVMAVLTFMVAVLTIVVASLTMSKLSITVFVMMAFFMLMLEGGLLIAQILDGVVVTAAVLLSIMDLGVSGLILVGRLV